VISNNKKTNLKTYLNRGVSLYELKKYENAQRDFLKVVNDNVTKDSALLEEAYVYLGKISESEKDFKKANEYYSKVIKLNPAYSAEAYYRSANTFEKLNKPVNAKRDIDNAAVAYSGKGSFQKSYGNNIEAKELYEKAINLNPKPLVLAIAYDGLGQCEYNLKQYDLAKKSFNRAIELNDESASSYLLRGDIYLQNKDYKSAISDFSKVVSLNNYLYKKDAYLGIGDAYFGLENYKEAITNYKKGLERREDYFGDELFKISECYKFLKDKEQYKYLQKAKKAFIKSGGSDIISKRYISADDNFSKVINLDKNYVTAYLKKGELNLKIKKYFSAINDFSKAITISPNYEKALIVRANLYRKIKQYNKSITDINELIRLLEEKGEKTKFYYEKMLNLRINNGYNYLNIKNYDKAIEYFENETDDNKLKAKIYELKGICLYHLGKYNTCHKFMNNAIKLDSSSIIANEIRSKLLSSNILYIDGNRTITEIKAIKSNFDKKVFEDIVEKLPKSTFKKKFVHCFIEDYEVAVFRFQINDEEELESIINNVQGNDVISKWLRDEAVYAKKSMVDAEKLFASLEKELLYINAEISEKKFSDDKKTKVKEMKILLDDDLLLLEYGKNLRAFKILFLETVASVPIILSRNCCKTYKIRPI